MRERTALLSSQQTALALHELPAPTPTTVIGEQSRPTIAVTSWTTMPRRPRIALADLEPAYRSNLSVQSSVSG